MSKKLLVVAGGTGGHIFPGIAVADYLKQQQWQVLWLGLKIEWKPKWCHATESIFDFIDMKGVRGNGIKSLIKAPFMVINAIFKRAKLSKAQKPDVLLAMGGYVTGPAGVAAKKLRYSFG